MTMIDASASGAAPAWPRRPGFWRRVAAFVVDYLVVFAFLVVAMAALFRFSDGAIQADFTLKFEVCYTFTPQWTGPSPPKEYDTWHVCNTAPLGFTIQSRLIGTSSSTGTAITLPLTADGVTRASVLNVGFFEVIALLAYFLVMEWRNGGSIGKRAVAITVTDDDDRRRVGLPIIKAIRRSLAKFLGLAPLALLQAWYAVHEWASGPELAHEVSTLEPILVFSVIALAPVWLIWIAVSIALGNDPIHDRFAETTVIKDLVEA